MLKCNQDGSWTLYGSLSTLRLWGSTWVGLALDNKIDPDQILKANPRQVDEHTWMLWDHYVDFDTYFLYKAKLARYTVELHVERLVEAIKLQHYVRGTLSEAESKYISNARSIDEKEYELDWAVIKRLADFSSKYPRRPEGYTAVFRGRMDAVDGPVRDNMDRPGTYAAGIDPYSNDQADPTSVTIWKKDVSGQWQNTTPDADVPEPEL